MDGVLIIDKPAGITSHDVVDRVRRLLKTRRVGHTGTLDPFATGVMVVLVGRATRLAQFLDKDEKEYEAVVRFGFETDSGDATGQRREVVIERDRDAVTTDNIESVLFEFTGKIEQVPPMYSAKKVDGKKLYESARKGVEIERQPVSVTVTKLELLETAKDRIRIRVACSAGTYIRTLAEDIGRALGIGAHLADLRRTRAGRFDLTQSISIDELKDMDEPAARLLPLSEAVAHLPAVTMADGRVGPTKNGLSTRLTASDLADGEAVCMLDSSDELLAVGIYDQAEKSIRPIVVLV